MTCFLGIDPGVSGACAFFYPKENRIAAYDMPVVANQINAPALFDLINQHAPQAAVIEDVHAMPGQGVSSMFRFGMAHGIAIGVVSASQIPLTFITPSRWKRAMHVSQDKEECRARAIQLWPSSDAFRLKKHHGRAEAALLAKWGAENLT